MTYQITMIEIILMTMIAFGTGALCGYDKKRREVKEMIEGEQIEKNTKR